MPDHRDKVVEEMWEKLMVPNMKKSTKHELGLMKDAIMRELTGVFEKSKDREEFTRSLFRTVYREVGARRASERATIRQASAAASCVASVYA